MLDFSNTDQMQSPSKETPTDMVDALRVEDADVLALIENDISFYEKTGILKGRALAMIKSLNVEKGASGRSQAQRPELLVA